MRKLFGPSKSKNKPSKDFGAEEAAPVPTPIHAHHAKFLSKPSPQQRQKQTEAQVPPQAVPHGQASAGVGGPEPGWENIPTPGNTPGVGPPPPLMGGGVSRSSSYHSIPSPNLNPNYNGRPPSPSLTNTSFSRQAAGYSPNPNDYGARPVPTKKSSATAPVALGILAALDPHANPAPTSNTQQTVSHSHSEERFYSSSENGHPQQQQMYPGQGGGGGYVAPPPERKEKRGFWSSGRDRDRDRRDQQPYEYVQSQPPPRVPGDAPRHSAESERTLTSMIGYLAATNSEDWSVVLEVCDRASLNETNAKEAVKALRSEFKYGQPHAQLAAAKLWAIMLRNSTDIFISQSRQRKFLDTLEELIKSGRSTPVVTDRLLEIIAAAAYASGRHKKGSEKDGFRGLWLRVKPADKPDEGIPFDSEDAMFSPPSARASTYETGAIVPAVALQQASPLPAENFAPVRHKPAGTRNRIIPHDEDIRRLFQECKMAVGNATLLSEALLTCTPSSLKNNAIIKEFHKKCENSQKLVFAQIEWATAQAEQSRVKRNAEREQRGGDDGEGRGKERESRKKKKDGKDGDDETTEEKLLGALLGANEELLSALRQYDDLYQILVEKKSRKDVRMDPREIAQHQLQQQTEHLAVAHGVGASRSRSPSPARSVSGSPPSNSTPPSHGGHGSNVGHAHSQSYQGTTGVGGVYTTHQGSYTNINQPAQLHGQPGAVYANTPYTDQNHGQTYTNNYRSPPEHDASSLAPPPKAPYGPRSPGNFSLRSRTPSPNGNNRPDEYSNNTQHSSVGGDHHGGTGGIVLTHNEAYSGSYDDHAHAGQQQGYGGHYGGYQDGAHHGGTGYQDDNASSIYYPQGGQEYRGQQEYQPYQHDTTLQYGAEQMQEEEVEYDEEGVPIRPSAKALGKRKAQEPVEEEHNPRASITSEDLYLSQQGILSLGPNSDTDTDSISSANARHNDGGGGINLNGSSGGASHGGKAWMSPPTQYVYDAAAERTRQRLEEAQKAVAAANAAHDAATMRPLVNGVH